MDFLKIQGGNPLFGEIEVSGSKNSALPIIACGLMVDGNLTLKNVEWLGVIGANGSGKSTFLKGINSNDLPKFSKVGPSFNHEA